MLSPFLQKTASGLRYTLPAVTCVLFILMGVMVWPVPYIGSVAPSFGLAGIYYWAMYRPDLLRPSLVFVLGVFADILNFTPMGLTAIVYIAAYQLSYSQRRFFVGQLFSMLWFGFAIIALLASLSQWAYLSIRADKVMAFYPVLFQLFMTIALFPLPAFVLNKLQKSLLTGG